jgi:glycosyltransferase involved in cell wall biosynthesis
VGHISGVANALMDLGHPVDFYSAGGRLLVDARAEHIALEPPRMQAMPFETTYYRYDRTCERQILGQFKRRVPGFMYQRMSIGNYTGVRLSRQFGIPLVLEYNGSEAWIAKNWGRPLRYHAAAVEAEDVCLRHSHLVVTVSEVLGRELESRGVPRERIVVYPNCIDPAMFDPAAHPSEELGALRAKYGFEPGHIVATFIGTFGQWHGVDVLASTIRRMIDQHRDFLDRVGLRFLLVGDGLKMPLVKEALAGAEQGPYVRLAGLVPQTEAPKYLAASDLLLSPHVKNPDGTAFFGSPTKLFEYLAMGRGIVASDLDQLGEVLRPAISPAMGPGERPASAVAVLVPPGEQEALIEGIKLLASHPEVRTTLGRNARELALGKYTWRHHTQAILDGLHRVVDRP